VKELVTMRSARPRRTAGPILIAAVALVAAGCDSTGDTTTTSIASTTATPESTAATEVPTDEGFTYEVGMIGGLLRTSYREVCDALAVAVDCLS
jgi:hypothetical protein